eukprot:g2434.t1
MARRLEIPKAISNVAKTCSNVGDRRHFIEFLQTKNTDVRIINFYKKQWFSGNERSELREQFKNAYKKGAGHPRALKEKQGSTALIAKPRAGSYQSYCEARKRQQAAHHDLKTHRRNIEEEDHTSYLHRRDPQGRDVMERRGYGRPGRVAERHRRAEEERLKSLKQLKRHHVHSKRDHLLRHMHYASQKKLKSSYKPKQGAFYQRSPEREKYLRTNGVADIHSDGTVIEKSLEELVDPHSFHLSKSKRGYY